MPKFTQGDLVYVAHPYGGQHKNKKKAKKIIQHLFEQYPGVTFVSPIHGIVAPYHSVPYLEGMKLCTELLSRCDSLLLTGSWEKSRGCCIEKEFAAKHRIKTIVLGEI